MNKFSFLLIVLTCFTWFNGLGQEKKLIQADDLLIREKVINDPTIYDRYVQYEKGFQMFIEQMKSNDMYTKTDTLIDGKKIIPVVFHIIHRYGPENISDAQVYDAIERINIDYVKMNADTAATYPLFQSRAANIGVEFRLATIDPDGNCTSGIVRHFDTETDYAYFATMKEYHWPTDKYMNIFVVNFIYPEGMSLPDGAFIGGMSPFPPSNTLSQALTGGDTDMDGVLIRHDGIGAIGTAENMGGMPINALNRTFTHESGHYFNLYHPFQVTYGAILGYDGCGPTFLGCGDEVDDTPPVATASQNTTLSCITPGSVNSCTETNDEPDMVENYMDYQFGYCTNIFTVGQKDRMDATLMGDRRNLWSVENLIATGVLDTTVHTPCAPIADFNAAIKSVCTGGTIEFQDASFNGTINDRTWYFEGGLPATSTDVMPLVTYEQPGVYAVSYVVSNSQGSDSIAKTSYIYVYDPTPYTSAPVYDGFENGLPGDWAYVNEAGSTWEWHTPEAYEGVRCLKMPNFTGNLANSIDAIATPGYNLTTLGTNKTLRLKFSYAYAGKINAGTIVSDADTAYDKFRVYVSTDCGKTWALKWTRLGDQMATTDALSTEFVPTDISQWKTDSINIHTYLTSGATNFRIKFEFTGNGGNSLYLDNVIIDNYTLSAEEFFKEVLSMQVFPNPANSNATLALNLPQNDYLKVTVLDVLGHEVKTIADQNYSAGDYNLNIPVSEFPGKGVYFIRMTYGDYTYTSRLVAD